MFATVHVTFITPFPPRKDVDFTQHPMTAILEARNMISDGGTIVQHYKHIDIDSIVLHMNQTLIDVSKTMYACRCKDRKLYFCSIALEAIDKLKSGVIGRYKLQKTNVHNIKMIFPQTEETFLPRFAPIPKTYSKKDDVRYENFKISNKIPIFTMHDVLFEAGYVRRKKNQTSNHVVIAPLTVYFKYGNTDQRGNKNKRTLRSTSQPATLVTAYQGGQAPSFAQRVFCPCAVNTLKMGRVLFPGYINTLKTYHECSEKMKQRTTVVKKLPWGTFHICDPFMEKTNTFKEEQENYERSEICHRGKRDIRNGMKCTFDKARRDGMNEMSDTVFVGEDANVHGICKWRLIFMHMTEYFAQATVWSTKNPGGASDVNVPRKCNIMMTRIWPLLFKLILFDIVESKYCAFCKGKVWPTLWKGMSTEDYFLKKVVLNANMMFGGTYCNLSIEEGLPKICVPCIMHCIASDIKYIRDPCPRTVKT